MTHLITGGSGFLGNRIARRLAARGERVRVLDLWKDESQPSSIEFIRGDVRNPINVAQAMRGVDVVHHTAALVPLTKAGKDFETTNVNGSRIVAQEAGKAKVKMFVHLSSSAVYGSPECPITEKTPFNPVEIYGRSKLAGERAVQEECSLSNTPLAIVRPRTIVGEGRLGIFQILFQRIQQNRNIYVIGNGEQKFQFVHTDDLMDAYMLAVDTGKPGAYNVGTPQFNSLKSDLEELIYFACSRSKVIGLPANLTINTLRVLDWLGLSPLAPWHYLTYHKPFYFDVTPLLKMGWTPKYSNTQALQNSYKWFLENKGSKNASPHRRNVEEGFLSVMR